MTNLEKELFTTLIDLLSYMEKSIIKINDIISCDKVGNIKSDKYYSDIFKFIENYLKDNNVPEKTVEDALDDASTPGSLAYYIVKNKPKDAINMMERMIDFSNKTKENMKKYYFKKEDKK